MQTGFIKPHVLNEDEMAAALAVVKDARPVLDKWARRIYGSNEIKQFRRDFVAGTLQAKIPNDERATIRRLFDVAESLLGSVVLSLAELAWTFTNSRVRPTLDWDDYFQEACAAADDAIWTYNGSTQYITSAVTAARNRLVDLVRKGKTLLEPLPESSLLTGGKAGDSDAAVTLETLAVDGLDSDTGHEYDMDVLWQAIQTAELNPIERELFNAYLADETGFQARIARDYSKTRSWANQNYQSACRKIRDTYQALCEGVKKAA